MEVAGASLGDLPHAALTIPARVSLSLSRSSGVKATKKRYVPGLVEGKRRALQPGSEGRFGAWGRFARLEARWGHRGVSWPLARDGARCNLVWTDSPER